MENIYITWHYTTHGIAYLKHILSAFYSQKCSPADHFIRQEKINQGEMNRVFDSPSPGGFLFDKIYYLTAPQESFDKISSRRFYYRKNILDDGLIREKNLLWLWKKLLSLGWEQYDDCLEREVAYVQKNYPRNFEAFKALIWRDMQHYSIASQINWFLNMSNAAPFYKNRFQQKELQIHDLRDSVEIAQKTQKFVLDLPKKHANARFVINVALGSNETQVVWHIFAEAGLLPQNTKLIFTYDDKSDSENQRFRNFRIKEIPQKLISDITQSFQLYESPRSQRRKLAEYKLQNYLKQGFAILMLGERGIGKTHLIEKYKGKLSFADANCASFEDDSKAEAELFGYEKGAFTGAEKRTDGLFHAAKGGILFLDEFHHLSKRVQAKLMKALQTDANNNLNIRRLGANQTEKLKCQIIMATNKPISALRQILLPDLYDRVSQLIIELPPLRQTPEDRPNDWRNIWEMMRFDKHPLTKNLRCPETPELIRWLQGLNLFGNYRDLQKIAIYYHTYLTFDRELKKMLPQKSAYEFAKAEFEKYYSLRNQSAEKQHFSQEKTPKEMLTLFRKELAQWAIAHFGSAPAAAKHFSALGDKTTARTLYQWKNGK